MKSFVDAVTKAEKYSTKEGKFKALSNLTEDGKRLIVEALSPYRVLVLRNIKNQNHMTLQMLNLKCFSNFLINFILVN